MSAGDISTLTALGEAVVALRNERESLERATTRLTAEREAAQEAAAALRDVLKRLDAAKIDLRKLASELRGVFADGEPEKPTIQ